MNITLKELETISSMEALKAFIEAKKSQPTGNVHLLARLFGVEALSDIPAGAELDFGAAYLRYNEIRPKLSTELPGTMKSFPAQMWRDQGIKWEQALKDGKAVLRFLSWDEAKMLAFRAKNADAKKAKAAKAKADKEAAATPAEPTPAKPKATLLKADGTVKVA